MRPQSIATGVGVGWEESWEGTEKMAGELSPLPGSGRVLKRWRERCPVPSEKVGVGTEKMAGRVSPAERWEWGLSR